MEAYTPQPQRRTHRKRISALRLSSDTTSTLPEYTQWLNQRTPEDKPPEYEADDDTDGSPPVSPRRRVPPRLKPRRSASASEDGDGGETNLDALLARSVHALEMSNALLQSSISTKSTLNNILGSTDEPDMLEARARNLSSRIGMDRHAQDSWIRDMDEINRGVDGLFQPSRENSISSSLPTTSPIHNVHRRRPSIEFRQTDPSAPHLRHAPQDRQHLISPPPRALTQYVAAGSSEDPEEIYLPSTIGLRHGGSDFRKTPTTSPRIAQSLPTDGLPTPGGSAYDILQSLVTKHSPKPSSSGTSSPHSLTSPPRSPFITLTRNRSRRSSASTTSNTSLSTSSRTVKSHSESPRRGRSRSHTPNRVASPAPQAHHQPPPPIEEESSLSSSSSSSIDAQQSISCLRKILSEQPPPPPPPHRALRPPSFLPRSPPVEPDYGTSNATASVSRLFTRHGGKHTSSARAASPPRMSSLKGKRKAEDIVVPSSSTSTTATTAAAESLLSVPPTPTSASGTSGSSGSSSFVDLLGYVFPSRSTSGASTPLHLGAGRHGHQKRISFAELPESYASTRTGETIRARRTRRRVSPGSSNSKRGTKKKGETGDGEDERQGWLSWLFLPVPDGAGSEVGVSGRGARGMMGNVRGMHHAGPGPGMGSGMGMDEWGV